MLTARFLSIVQNNRSREAVHNSFQRFKNFAMNRTSTLYSDTLGAVILIPLHLFHITSQYEALSTDRVVAAIKPLFW